VRGDQQIKNGLTGTYAAMLAARSFQMFIYEAQ